jgi:hypothetical protein
MQNSIFSIRFQSASIVLKRIKTNPWLTSLLCIVFLCTVFYSFWFQIPPQVDARSYDQIGWNLANGHNYRVDASSDLSQDGAIVSLGPGYEIFLAGIYFIFGHVYAFVWILQALLHAINTWLVYRIVLLLLADDEKSNRFAILGAALFGFHPDLIQIAAMLMTETLFIFCMLCGAYFAFRFVGTLQAKHLLCASIFLAIDVLIRPTALLFVLVLLILAAWKKRAWLIIGIVILQLAIIGPWTLRNYVVYQKFIFTTSAGGSNFWIGNNAQATGEIDPTPEITAYLYSHNSVEAEQHGWEEVKNFIITDPVAFFRLQLVKTMKFFSILRTSAWWWNLSGASRVITFILSAAFSFFLFVFGAQGMWLAFRTHSVIGKLITTWALLIPASVVPFIVETRYRYPMYPFLAILTAWAIWHLWTKRTQARSFLFWGGLVFTNAAIDAISNAPDMLDHIRQLLPWK